MNAYDYWIKKILIAVGVVELAVGTAHFFMPGFIRQSKGFSFLNPDETAFVTLGICAIGILLTAFGMLTLLFAFKLKDSGILVFYYVMIKTLAWSARIILEILYPVKIPMFFLNEPQTGIFLVLVFAWLLFMSAAVLMVKGRRKSMVHHLIEKI